VNIRFTDNAVAAQHDGPGEDADETVAPEGQDDEQEQRLARAALDLPRQHIGTWVSDQHAAKSDDGGQQQRAGEQVGIDRTRQELGVVQCSDVPFGIGEWRGRQEAEEQHGRQWQENRHCQPEIGWRQKNSGAQRVV
jgi:hypothetical protein